MLDNENEIDDSSNDNGAAKQNDRLAQQKRNRLKAIVYANTVQAICGKHAMITRPRKELFKVFKLLLAQYEETMSVF